MKSINISTGERNMTRKTTILIVEDDPDLRKLVRT